MLFADRQQRAGLVGDIPFHHVDGIDRLFAEGFSIEEKLHRIGIRERHDADALTFAARPIPMGNDFEHVLVFAPVGLMNEKRRLRKSTQVQNPERGTGTRPLEGGGFASVVETGPDKAARNERALGDLLPTIAVRGPPTSRVGVARVGGLFLHAGLIFAARDEA